MVEKKYLVFDLLEEKPKTNVYLILRRSDRDAIGTIRWCPQWRQYWSFTDEDVGLTSGCHKEIAEFIDLLMDERKIRKLFKIVPVKIKFKTKSGKNCFIKGTKLIRK